MPESHIYLMVDGGYDPRYSKTHKDVHRVAARHVSDGVVRRLLRGGRDLAGEGVGQGGAESHKGDGRDLKKQSLHENCCHVRLVLSLTSGFSPTMQPNISARSPTTMTVRPIMAREMTKQG